MKFKVNLSVLICLHNYNQRDCFVCTELYSCTSSAVLTLSPLLTNQWRGPVRRIVLVRFYLSCLILWAFVCKLAALCTCEPIQGWIHPLNWACSSNPVLHVLLACFFSVLWTITIQHCVWKKKKNPSRFIEWLLEFLFPKKKRFLWAAFSKLPFSPEFCQKMALLCTDSPSPLQQVIKS